MRKDNGTIIYSPSDLIRYLASSFASWLDRYHLEGLGEITPDEQTEEDVVTALALLGVKDGKADPAIAAARKDAIPVRKGFAAMILGRVGTAEEGSQCRIS